MARPRFTTDAWRDLDEIMRYTGERDPDAAA
jgi:plasmid stabilization system protein ParE